MPIPQKHGRLTRLERFVIFPVFSPHRLASSSTGRASAVRPRHSYEKTAEFYKGTPRAAFPTIQKVSIAGVYTDSRENLTRYKGRRVVDPYTKRRRNCRLL